MPAGTSVNLRRSLEARRHGLENRLHRVRAASSSSSGGVTMAGAISCGSPISRSSARCRRCGWRSSTLASVLAVAVLGPEILWNVDLAGRLLLRRRITGLTDYMFEPERPAAVAGTVTLPRAVAARAALDGARVRLRCAVGPWRRDRDGSGRAAVESLGESAGEEHQLDARSRQPGARRSSRRSISRCCTRASRSWCSSRRTCCCARYSLTAAVAAARAARSRRRGRGGRSASAGARPCQPHGIARWRPAARARSAR